MKKFKFILVLSCCLALLSFTRDKKITPDCKCKGIPLYGSVRVVDAFPDFRVRVVDSFEDIRVMKIEHFSKTCGEWYFVDGHSDFTIMYVDSFEDFKVRFVDYFPAGI